MTKYEVELMFIEGKLDNEYADFIMEYSKGDRLICNGDMLTAAVEDGYMLEDFFESYANIH